MMKKHDLAVIKAITICFKAYLKPEEAMIYCNLGRTELAKKCSEYGIYKNNNGYYKREDLDRILSGAPTIIEDKVKRLKL